MEEQLKSLSSRLQEVERSLQASQKEAEKLRKDLDVCKKALGAISEIACKAAREVR